MGLTSDQPHTIIKVNQPLRVMSTLHHEEILEDLYDNSLYDQQLLKELEIEPYFSYTVAEMEAHAEKQQGECLRICANRHLWAGE